MSVVVWLEGPADPCAAPRSFAELVDTHGPVVRRVVGSVVRRDETLAEEVVCDVLYAAWSRREQFRGDSSFRSWVVAISRNRALTAVRRRDRQRSEAFDPEVHQTVIDDLELHVLERDVQRALAAFDGLTGQMLSLRLIDGRSYDEIAETLGVSLPTVKTRLHRGRRQLASQLTLLGWGPDAA